MEPTTTPFDDLERIDWPAIEADRSLRDAWRQCHHASQAPSEAGKGWAIERDDDSHSAFACDADAGRLVGAELVGATGVRAWMGFSPLTIGVGEESMALDGRTSEEALAWVRERCEAVAGPARQEARPAPDLPEHPTGDGAPFDASDARAFEAVGALYGATDRLLRTIAAQLDDHPTPTCWPHHFDHALLRVVERDAEGAMARTIGYGLAVPDDVEADGYLYVSGWMREGALEPSALADGLRWEGSMALMPVGSIGGAGAGPRVAAFVNAAHEALVSAMRA
jgi:hypothetical protein